MEDVTKTWASCPYDWHGYVQFSNPSVLCLTEFSGISLEEECRSSYADFEIVFDKHTSLSTLQDDN